MRMQDLQISWTLASWLTRFATLCSMEKSVELCLLTKTFLGPARTATSLSKALEKTGLTKNYTKLSKALAKFWVLVAQLMRITIHGDSASFSLGMQMKRLRLVRKWTAKNLTSLRLKWLCSRVHQNVVLCQAQLLCQNGNSTIFLSRTFQTTSLLKTWR